MAQVGSTSSSPGVLLHDWLEEESEESLNDDEIDEFVRINRAKNTVKKKRKVICEGGGTGALLLEKSATFWTSPQKN